MKYKNGGAEAAGNLDEEDSVADLAVLADDECKDEHPFAFQSSKLIACFEKAEANSVTLRAENGSLKERNTEPKVELEGTVLHSAQPLCTPSEEEFLGFHLQTPTTSSSSSLEEEGGEEEDDATRVKTRTTAVANHGLIIFNTMTFLENCKSDDSVVFLRTTPKKRKNN